ncbi:hypothetical protein niasHT_029138 [Heterodera trifolii]|uniref:RING-type domain-containing protein n=1 Tax=Heterodera trifolii TaxID=157864 RepID=A0ABD2K252_9BILA
MHHNFVLLLLSFCIKIAKFDSIKGSTNCDNNQQQQQNGNNSIFEELRQMYGKMLLAAFDQFPSISVDNELDCAICLDQINTGTLVKQLPSCEHIFHDECIKAWIQGGHNACPMCRQQLLAETEAQNEHQMDGIASGAEMGNSSNDPSVIVQINEEHQSQTSAEDEDEVDQNAGNTQMANMV